jgi:hypothetical protein
LDAERVTEGWVIAHEEVHQMGWDNPTHSTGEAEDAYDRCSQ